MRTERQVEASIKNFTPLLDDLVQKYGIVTAAVWGRVWRYAQQDNHVCQASHEKIAKELHLSIRTVVTHIHILVQNGYLFDANPDLRNVPHTYSITPKAKILITVEGLVNEEGMQEMHTGMQKIPNRYAGNAHEETIKETGSANKSHAPKGKDPRTNTPAVQMVRRITGKYPARSNYDQVIDILGDRPDEVKAADCYEKWTFGGRNPIGLGWLEWYRDGIPEWVKNPQGNRKSNGKTQQKTEVTPAPVTVDGSGGFYG